MVVIERRFARLLSYKMVFFANEASLHRVAENLKPTELARFFYLTDKLDRSRLVIGRDRNLTVCNDLRQPREKMWKGLAHCSRTDIRRAEGLGNLNRLLHWRNMLSYKEEGFDTYDWGGISDDRTDGRVRFKTSFGGAVVEEYTYLCAGWPQLGTIVQPLFDLAYVRVRLKSALKASTERTLPGRLLHPYRVTEGKAQMPRPSDGTRGTTDQPRAS